jgi:dsDNA-specific endonuclease/ATPase MutS2
MSIPRAQVTKANKFISDAINFLEQTINELEDMESTLQQKLDGLDSTESPELVEKLEEQINALAYARENADNAQSELEDILTNLKEI